MGGWGKVGKRTSDRCKRLRSMKRKISNHLHQPDLQRQNITTNKRARRTQAVQIVLVYFFPSPDVILSPGFTLSCFDNSDTRATYWSNSHFKQINMFNLHFNLEIYIQITTVHVEKSVWIQICHCPQCLPPETDAVKLSPELIQFGLLQADCQALIMARNPSTPSNTSFQIPQHILDDLCR